MYTYLEWALVALAASGKFTILVSTAMSRFHLHLAKSRRYADAIRSP